MFTVSYDAAPDRLNITFTVSYDAAFCRHRRRNNTAGMGYVSCEMTSQRTKNRTTTIQKRTKGLLYLLSNEPRKKKYLIE